MMRVIIVLGAIFSVSSAFSIASGQTNEIQFKNINPVYAPYGFIEKDHLWPSSIVNVCWENPNSSNMSARKTIEEAVEQTWENYANIKFIGWSDQCQSNAAGVHILIVDDSNGPRSLVGTKLDGVNNGVRINSTFLNWGHEFCADKVDSCTRTDAIHEFGHVLGLLHENLAPKAPDWCKNKFQSDSPLPSDAIEMTPYDANSIMNYCNMIYGKQTGLSELDKKVAALIYPFQSNQ